MKTLGNLQETVMIFQRTFTIRQMVQIGFSVPSYFLYFLALLSCNCLSALIFNAFTASYPSYSIAGPTYFLHLLNSPFPTSPSRPPHLQPSAHFALLLRHPIPSLRPYISSASSCLILFNFPIAPLFPQLVLCGIEYQPTNLQLNVEL
jgi:hypothetical protein